MMVIVQGSSSMIKGMIGTIEKEKEMHNINEMVNPPRKQGTLGMKSNVVSNN